MKSLLCGFLLGISLQASAETITIRSDPWCPHTCDPKTGKNGILIDIATEIFASHGHEVNYEILNWGRSIEETRRGKFNSIAGAYKNDAPDFIFPKNPQGQTSGVERA